MSRQRAIAGLLVVCLGTIAAPLDGAVNIAFPSITARFGLEVQEIRWVAIVYVLTYASLLLVFGRLGDLLGHRIVFQVGLLTAAAGFAACGAAPTYELLLAARVLQGVGVALILSCAPALATLLFQPSERTRILGIYSGMMALGGLLGPLVGGFFVAQFGWSAVFLARAPIVLLALALSWLIPARPAAGTSSAFDFIGSVQLALALIAILGGLSLGGGGFDRMLSPALCGLGIVLFSVFVQRQARLASPLIRPAVLRDPSLMMMNAASVIVNLTAFAVVLIGPFYLVGIARLQTEVAGAVLATAALGTMVGSGFAPRVIRGIGDIQTAGLGMALSAVGLAGIAAWPDGATIPQLLPALIVQGMGLGLFVVAYTDHVTAALPPGDRGVAGSLSMLTRSIGIVGGAAGLSHVSLTFGAQATAAGASAADAFRAGSQAVFVGACTLNVLALAVGVGLCALRRRRA